MEEVWKELSLSSLRHPSAPSADGPPVRGLTLEELVASPLNKATTIAPHTKTRASGETETLSSFDTFKLKSSAGFCTCSKRERGPDPAVEENANNRKKKRLMKNRESAARSRARKQAYTYELELEVAHLMEENAKLRKEQEEICAAAVASNRHQKKKHMLYRTLTAPF